jgi:hypothetical protein
VIPEPAPAPPRPDVRLITVSASYGAGGSVVAPALAGRLGLPFLQQVTTSEGHLAQPGPCDEQLTEEEVKATRCTGFWLISPRPCRPGPHSRRRPPTTRTNTWRA